MSQASHAEVYRIQDEDGKIIFTDTPPPGEIAKPVKLPVVNTQPAPAVRPAAKEDTPPASAYTQVVISSPVNDSTITPGQLDIIVQLSLKPARQKGHRVHLWYDNKPHSKPAPSTSFRITSLERGAHQLHTRIVDNAGKTIAQSKSVTIHVKRSSVNN